MKTLFDSSDIIRLFKETDKRIDKLECFFETCCAKVPINIGSGEGLYKRLHKNKWEFKSLIAGSNITITDNGNDLTITGTVTPISCQDIYDCLGISPSGSATKYLNEQGDWQTITIPANYITSVSDTSTVNLTVTAGDLTADVKLTEYQIGYGDANNKLTSNGNFYYNDVTTELFNVGFSSAGTSIEMSGLGDYINLSPSSFSILELTQSSLRVNLALFDLLSLDQTASLYQIGDYANSGFNTYIKIDDGGLSKNISLNATNGVIVSNLATPGTLMVVADATGLLSKQAIPTVTPAALTKTDDTNVTLTLGGTPATSLLQATSLTLGWTGTLADGRIASATNWNDAYTNRITSLTTTGTSGAATLIANVLNIPQYSATTRLDQILAATATNTISNANNAQVWNWDTLTTQTALKIASTSVTTGALLNLVSTSTASNGEIGLNVNMSGANANASRTSTGIYVSQTKSGTTPNNYGIDVSLSGATNIANKIGIRCVTSGGTNWGYNGYGAYISNTTIGSTQTGLYAEANASNLTATIGVYGKCGSAYNNASGYGVIGEAVGVGTLGFSYGVYGSAGNAVASNATANYGVYGISGGAGYATRYGGYFTSSGYTVGGSGNAGTCIGVYASASGGTVANYGLLVAAGSSGFLTTTPTSSVQINGSFAAGYVAKTANYTLTISDRLVNCTANSFTITLPTAVGITGREYIIKNTGTATTITIATTSAQTIDGLIPSTYNVTTLTPLRVMSDGANWITC